MINIPVVNNQPIEKQCLREDGSLDIVKVFLTIQGEGPLTGTPSVFVRLAGCSILCQKCDSDYTTNRHIISVNSLIDEINRIKQGSNLVVITGGEPFRQNIIPFIKELLYNDFHVQIETNGTLWVDLPKYDVPTWEDCFDYFIYEQKKCNLKNLSIVCSPKTPKVHPELEKKVDAWKYILHHDHVSPEDGLPTQSLGYTGTPARPNWDKYPAPVVYLQPEDSYCEETNKKNLLACLSSCYKYGYKISIQTHKIMELE